MQKKSSKEWIVGISYGHHESSCTILSNRGDLYFLREEWLSRVKLDYRFPKSSINYFLNNIIQDDTISTVCHFQKPLKNWVSIGTKQNLSAENYLLKIRQFKNSDIFIEKDLKKVLKKNKFDLIYCPHHLSHALASKPFAKKKKSLYLVLDGYGDGSSGAVFDDNFNTQNVFKPNQSLGLVYSAITEWAGFVPNEDEYKVMAIAAFGKPVFKDFILKNVMSFKNGSIFINESYFNFEDVSNSPLKPYFFKKFKKPQKSFLKTPLKDKHLCNLIASFQAATESIVAELITSLIKENNVDQIVCSGGLFHNSVLIGKLTKLFKKHILVPPCPGDAGSSIGAAFFGSIYKNWDLKKFNDKESTLSPFIGPEVRDIGKFEKLFELKSKGLKNSLSFAEELLKNDDIFATFDGRVEVGPRALGSRSLICNALSNRAVKKLNEIIKKREPFRPLAIMLNKSKFKTVFADDNHNELNLFWMGQVNWSKSKTKYAFLHHDNSSRPQIVDEKSKFCDKINTPKLLMSLLNKGNILSNTSFNIAGDPMVFEVEDVYINMIRMGIKYIFNNNNFYEIKNENSF
jgi:carbamoyltransferase